MHVAIATVSAICIGKGKHIIVKKNKIGSQRSEHVVTSCMCVLNIVYMFVY